MWAVLFCIWIDDTSIRNHPIVLLLTINKILQELLQTNNEYACTIHKKSDMIYHVLLVYCFYGTKAPLPHNRWLSICSLIRKAKKKTTHSPFRCDWKSQMCILSSLISFPRNGTSAASAPVLLKAWFFPSRILPHQQASTAAISSLYHVVENKEPKRDALANSKSPISYLSKGGFWQTIW